MKKLPIVALVVFMIAGLASCKKCETCVNKTQNITKEVCTDQEKEDWETHMNAHPSNEFECTPK